MLPILIVEDLLRAHGIGSSQIRLVAFLLRFPGLHLGFEGIDTRRLFRARSLQRPVIQQCQYLAAAYMVPNLNAD